MKRPAEVKTAAAGGTVSAVFLLLLALGVDVPAALPAAVGAVIAILPALFTGIVEHGGLFGLLKALFVGRR